MNVVPLTTVLAINVALNLRDRDRVEILSTEYGDDVCGWAARMVGRRGEHFALLTDQGTPVAMGGATMLWPGVAQTWLCATESLPRYAVALLRATRDTHIRHAKQGIHRFQTYLQPGYDTGRRFLERLGYVYEGTMRAATRYGQDLDIMALGVPR